MNKFKIMQNYKTLLKRKKNLCFSYIKLNQNQKKNKLKTKIKKFLKLKDKNY